ncbi:alpha-galactosidase, partial [candidate division KSB1 bacterium]|nr:alpha-galactosidase [candidate division KSB1 bacterium]
QQLNLQLRITLYDGLPSLFVQLTCENVGRQPMTVSNVQPLCAIPSEGGLHWFNVAKILTNGQMYADPGAVSELTSDSRRSWWNVAFFSGYEREGLVCGSIDNEGALGQLSVGRGANGLIALTAESFLAHGFVLQPGRAISSNRFMLHIGENPYQALETYADTMGRLGTARVHSMVNGWCSWFYTYESVTEEEVIRNAEYAARTLKPFGFEYVQVDEGYQRWHGDWEGNEKFPHGMGWLAERIRELGLKPGLWIAPYIISEPTDLFQKHPEWLLHHPDGRLRRVGPWPSEESEWAQNENPKRYGLDITHPGAAEWLCALFDKIRQWGYEMIKIDFVGWSLLAAERYHDPTVSQAAAYRRGFGIMRKHLGPDCHLQDCGPGPVTVGLLDSMRIELDQNYGYRQNAWQQYFLTPSGSAAAAAKRYYFHGRTWTNDADHICLHLLSLSQAQAAATLIALTGGNIISGDRLMDLDAPRQTILQKILPSVGQAARPVDLFDTDAHRVFAMTLKRSFGEWTIAGFFNPEGTVVEQVMPLERLWLDPTKSYIAYDFWQEQLLGVFEREVRVQTPPTSVTLLALHEKRGVPQVISTDRHVLQGALELADVHWDTATQILSGVSLGPIGSAHHVMIHLPEPHPWVQGRHALYHDYPGYSFKMTDEHLVRLRVRFETENNVRWQVSLKELLG